MFPPVSLHIISSPGGALITCMQHLCAILLERGRDFSRRSPGRAVARGGFCWGMTVVRTGEDKEEPSQSFPCSTVLMGCWLPSKVLRCPLQGRGLVVLPPASSLSQYVWLCPRGVKCVDPILGSKGEMVWEDSP